MRMFCPPVGLFAQVGSSPPAVTAGFWTDAAAIANAGSGAVSMTPTTFSARSGQAFLLAIHQVGGNSLTGLTIGGVTPFVIYTTNGGSGSRWVTWHAVDSVSAANPVCSWSAGQSNNIACLFQVVGVDVTTLTEADFAIDTGNDNDELVVDFTSQQGAVLAFASRAWDFTAGMVEDRVSASNLCAGAALSTDTAALQIRANRPNGTTQADRMLSAIRLPLTGSIGGGSGPSLDFSIATNSQYLAAA